MSTPLRGRILACACAAVTLTVAGCGGTGIPKQLPAAEATTLSEASKAIIGACSRGPLTPEQERALQPRLQLLIDATKRDPEILFAYPQEDDNPLLTTPSFELQAVVGALGGVGPQAVCSRRLAARGDRGLVAAGKASLLADMPSARE